MNIERSLRGDIQGLRAVAVGLVLLFHVWPDLVPGGYVGVDVFFVISGYLIVGSLFREAERTGAVSLVDFYSRRIRRLLPAATLVLIVVLLVMFMWLPQAWWEDTLFQIAASVLYLENWYLALAAVDYLAAENTPSPVQHYWSLSIEEQFYIVWPLVMLVVLWVARRSGLTLKPLVLFSLGLVFAGSLTASILLTATDPGRAYFVTHTRAWELALGGLLAVSLPRINASDRFRAVLCFAGLAAILTSGFTFGGVAFPGHTALLPTLGTALVLLSGEFRIGFIRGLDIAPMRYLGDISYSLYLWHWPIVVFFLATGKEIGVWEGVTLIALMLMVSHLSYRFVEERFRHPGRRGELRPLPYGFASILAVAAITSISYLTVVWQTPETADSASDVSLYPGPAALVANVKVPEDVPLLPAPTHLLRDRAVVYDSGCHQNQEDSEAIVCEFGDPSGETTVALIGSSHSVNWLPAFDILGRKNSWKILSITKSSCGFREEKSDSCLKWHDNVMSYLDSHSVDLVVISEFAGKSTSRAEGQRVANRWKRISDLGIPIFAIQSIPHLATRPGDCLPERINDCVIPRADAERANVIAVAVEQVPGVQVIDMNDMICPKETCGPVVGNLVVYRDKHHLTATYAIALAPYLEQAIVRSSVNLLPIRDGNIEAQLFKPRRPATLLCGPVGQLAAFSRSYSVVLRENKIEFRRGDWRKRDGKFEAWDGEIREDKVIIRGKYIEGSGGIKRLRLSGSIRDGVIVASGKRGPRECTLEWPVDDEGTRNAPRTVTRH